MTEILITTLCSGLISGVIVAALNNYLKRSYWLFEETHAAAAELNSVMLQLNGELKKQALDKRGFESYLNRIQMIRNKYELLFTEEERGNLATVAELSEFLLNGNQNDKKYSFDDVKEVLIPIVRNYGTLLVSVENRYHDQLAFGPRKFCLKTCGFCHLKEAGGFWKLCKKIGHSLMEFFMGLMRYFGKEKSVSND